MEKFKNKVIGAANFYNTSFLNFDLKLTEMNYLTFKDYFKGKLALEIGPAIGQMTKFLVNDFEKIHLLEGSETLLQQIPEYDNIVKHHAFIEEFSTHLKFDTVIMGHVLEHIENPLQVLKLIYQWLSDDGIFIVSVPNAQSLHRLAAVEMGMLDSIYTLNSRDLELGHYRVYDMQTLKNELTNAGYNVVNEGGVFLKPLSNIQIEQNWNDDMIKGFYKLGKKFPKNCAEIFVICTK
jgi:2-polyprenyl-3-methyl-5-hydroxy-6-metoxy-1,4-benzoquinol methylase